MDLMPLGPFATLGDKVSDEKRWHRYLHQHYSPTGLEQCCKNRRKAVQYVTTEIGGEIELFPGPQVLRSPKQHQACTFFRHTNTHTGLYRTGPCVCGDPQ